MKLLKDLQRLKKNTFKKAKVNIMNKKQIAKQYIRNNVDFIRLREDINSSNVETQAYRPLIMDYFYKTELKAIEKANYKNPNSDRTWETMANIRVELLKEMKEGCL